MAVRTTNLDAVIASVPVNKDAAVALGRSGVHYDPQLNIQQAHYDIAPSTVRVPKGTPDLTGVRYARMRVVGYLGRHRNPKKPGLWLVRCACGKFEERSGKAIKNAANSIDCCHECRHVESLRKPNHHQRPGSGGWRDRMKPA